MLIPLFLCCKSSMRLRRAPRSLAMRLARGLLHWHLRLYCRERKIHQSHLLRMMERIRRGVEVLRQGRVHLVTEAVRLEGEAVPLSHEEFHLEVVETLPLHRTLPFEDAF